MQADAHMTGFWAAFGEGRWDDVFERFLTADCEFTMPGMPTLQGRAQIAPLFEAYLRAFPDFTAQTLCSSASADLWAAESEYHGTHAGPLVGPEGAIPPTGREVRWRSGDFVQFRDGRIASWRVYHDRIGFLAQLGVGLG